MKTTAFLILAALLFMGSFFFMGLAMTTVAQDSVKVSLKDIDAEISQLVERQKTLAQQIEGAQKDIIYMQGMIDILQAKRKQLTPPIDSTKIKLKKK